MDYNYDYEDSPRFWAMREMEKQLYYEELERRLKNDPR